MPEIDVVALAAKTGMSPTQAVRLQSLDDYPASAVSWMSKLDWNWPSAVPLDKIDYTNKAAWSADADPKKLKKFHKKMCKGLLKPAILVCPKGKDKYVVVDGHHRALTALSLKRPLMAWTAEAPTAHGPWDIMHDQQSHDSTIKASTLELAADSMAKASTPQPVGPKPLWKKTKPKPWHLPFYIEHVANALIKHGHSESEAISMAVGIVRAWAQKKPEGGEKSLHGDTQAAAAKAIAEWENLKKSAHSSKG